MRVVCEIVLVVMFFFPFGVFSFIEFINKCSKLKQKIQYKTTWNHRCISLFSNVYIKAFSNVAMQNVRVLLYPWLVQNSAGTISLCNNKFQVKPKNICVKQLFKNKSWIYITGEPKKQHSGRVLTGSSFKIAENY